MKKRLLWLLPVLAAVMAALALSGVLSSAPVAGEPSQALLEASDGLDEIVIEARLLPESRALEVVHTLTLENRTGQALEHSVLRTWPNAFQSVDTSPCSSEELYDACYPDGFSMGALVMSEALVARGDGQPQTALYRYADDAKTVLYVSVEGGWQPGERVTLTLRYTVYVPRAAYRFGVNGGIWALGGAFAVPAVFENGAWREDEYLTVGDPFLSECANYALTVEVPEGYVCAGGGPATAETANGVTTYRFSCPAVREAALVISEGYAVAEAMEAGVLVRAYATDAARARQLLSYGAKALAFYGERYGAYPWQTFSLCEADFAVGGMEYPGLVMIGSSQISLGGSSLEYVVAHETAHQWWYAAVGSDPWYQSWQDEALCEFSVLEYMEHAHGASVRADLEQSQVQSAMKATVARGITPGSPLDVFTSMSQYSLVVYNRGAALFLALDSAIPDGLNAFLRAYYQTFAFKIATRADFEELLASVTGGDYAPLMRDYLDTYILN